MRTTVLTNVFNEEWLLPFWLEHHKDMFDHGVVLDYHSTDGSMDFVRRICPHWDIRTTRNEFFDAKQIDLEFMDIERETVGYCVVLNTTEFLCAEKSLKDLLPDKKNKCFQVTSWSPYNPTECNPSTLRELLGGFDLASPSFRSPRFIHSCTTGRYAFGRHETQNTSERIDGLWLLWMGHYPMCESMWQRKLQIKAKMSENDKQKGFGHQHTLPKSGMEQQRDELLVPTCQRLEETQPRLFAMLRR